MSGTKRHRIRAHVNPLAVGDYVFPLSPDMASWNTHYPYFYPEEDMLLDDSKESKRPEVTIADVGCGFGGLSVTLSRFLALFPSTLILAMEIRDKVVSIVQKRIASLREETKPTDWPVAASCIPPYSNVSVVRTNAMKYLVNFFRRAQLEKIFFCFPDPHFKKANHRRRIISHNLLSEYAYVLREGGIIYTITDVLDLHHWMTACLSSHPLFLRIPDVDLINDPAIEAMTNGTEEGQKVSRSGGSKYIAVFRRVASPV